MRRTLPARAGAALLVIPFLLAVNGSAARYHCADPAQQAAPAYAGPEHHGAQHHQHAPPSQPAPPGTCSGNCCCAPPAGLPEIAFSLETGATVTTAPAPIVKPVTPWLAWSLPFATGPPLPA